MESYIQALDPAWQPVFRQALAEIDANMPPGFELVMQYGMPCYVVPLSTYPAGYLDQADVPLPFLSLGMQKHHLALYHMGLYAFPEHLAWFQTEYARRSTTRLDMGKSCVRFRNSKTIPVSLLGELARRITAQEWVEKYETSRQRVVRLARRKRIQNESKSLRV